MTLESALRETLGRPTGSADSLLLPDVLQDAESFYAERVATWALRGFSRFAGQARSRSAREVFVRAASSGRHTLLDLERWVGHPSDDAVHEVAACDKRLLMSLATLIGDQRLDDKDTWRAIQLFALLERAHGPRAFSRLERLHYLELLAESGDAHSFNRAFAANALSTRDWAQAALFSANFHNPWQEGAPRVSLTGEWHARVNAIYRAAGVEAIEVLDGRGPALDRILCSPANALPGGPCVTVMIPTRNPGPRFATALSSVLSQSWQNLEVLILDDGSDPDHRHRLRAWADSDRRVRVLEMGANIGNYAARNIGMEQASGEFVTVHDDDDWSHPRKIEMQARHLLEHSDCLANMSHMVRTTPELKFLRINSNPSWIQPNYSSLMYRRKKVVDLIGYWDEAAKAADAEYRNRLTAATGVAPPAIGGAPMSFMRVRSGSLTEGEIQRAHIDPRRYWYDLGSRRWHARTVENGEVPKLLPAASPRPFVQPWGLQPGTSSREPLQLDVLYATDFRFPGGNSSVTVSEVASMLRAGLRVGLLQLDSPVLMGTTDLNDRVLQVAGEEECYVVTVKDEVEADLVIVRHPTVLQFAEQRRSAITGRHHVLIVNHAPAQLDGTEAHYDINTCVESFSVIFGSEPQVAPESGVIRACLAPLTSSAMTTFDWTGTIDEMQIEPRRADVTRAPVWGRHSRDNREKWPTNPTAISAAYPLAGADVRFLGGAQVAIDRLGVQPTGWTIYPFGSREPKDFLRELDFWVYFHAENLIESFGMATLEAMAAGLVVILPEYMEATFGDGAVYCQPERVSALINEVWSAPEVYHRQSELALNAVRTRFLSSELHQRLSELRR